LIAGRTKSTYITNQSIHKHNQSDIINDRNVDGNLKNVLELFEAFEFEKFFKSTTVDINEESAENTERDDISYTLSEHFYNKLLHEGLQCFELPTQHVNILSAFNMKSNRVKKLAMLDVKIDEFKVNQIVMLPPQFLTD
jgi:hypothetical protein